MFGASKVVEQIVEVEVEEVVAPKGKGKATTKAKVIDPIEQFADLRGTYGLVEGIVKISMVNNPRWGIFKKLNLGWFGAKFLVTFEDGTQVIFGPVNPVMLMKRDGTWRKLNNSKLQNSAFNIQEMDGWNASSPIADLQALVEDEIGEKKAKDEIEE